MLEPEKRAKGYMEYLRVEFTPEEARGLVERVGGIGNLTVVAVRDRAQTFLEEKLLLSKIRRWNLRERRLVRRLCSDMRAEIDRRYALCLSVAKATADDRNPTTKEGDDSPPDRR